jgi:hypothetical protein
MSYVFDIDCEAHRWVSLRLAHPALFSKRTAVLVTSETVIQCHVNNKLTALVL